MRDLTEEELKLVPDWAVYYVVYSGEVVFGNSTHYQRLYANGLMGGKEFRPLRYIPRKKDDLINYRFSDENIVMCRPSWIGEDAQIEIIDENGSHHEAVLNKSDAIAIAKALGVTGEDLK